MPVYRLLPLLLASLSSSGCMFLLDFDELKESESDAGLAVGGSGGSGGSLGQAGESSAGQGGGVNPPVRPPAGGQGGGVNPPVGPPAGGAAGNCDDDCLDDDPCTVDVCTPTGCSHPPMDCTPADACMTATCVDGTCVETPAEGVVFDNYADSVSADFIYRTEIVGGGDRFFTATYGQFNGTNDLRVGAFNATGDAAPPRTQSLASGLMSEGLQVGSAAAMIFDARTATPELNVYVGVRANAEPSAPGELLWIRFFEDLSLVVNEATKLGSSPSYEFASNTVGPAAAQLPTGEPFVVWPGRVAQESGLLFQVAGNTVDVASPGAAFIPLAEEVAGLVALHAGDTPAAVWLTEAPEGVSIATGTNAGTTPLELAQCHRETSASAYSLHGARTLDELWTVSWSKQGDDGFTTENAVLSCAGAQCVDANGLDPTMPCSEAQSASRITNDVRNLTVESFIDPANPNLLYQVILLATDTGTSSSIALVVKRLDLDSPEDAGVVLGSTTIANGSGATSPNWPEVAVVAPGRLGISWLESSAGGAADEAHFARYRICGL